MEALIVYVEGIGWWSSAAADWTSAAPLLRSLSPLTAGTPGRPEARLLPANERRRAPMPVLIACDVGAQACAMADRQAADLPCVFASVHGDLVITDAMCATLADDPRSLSPTRFHNSVHNTAAGYWTVATHCHAASSAISTGNGSFTAGLFEAAVQALAEASPVLLMGGEVIAPGPLANVANSPDSFGAALVLAPVRGPRTVASLRLRHRSQAADATGHTPLADTLPLFTALAGGQPAALALRSGDRSCLAIEVTA